MPKPHLCALVSVLAIAALQTWPAAASPAGERPLSQERWMFQRDGARTVPRPEVRVHFFRPDQTVRVSQRSVDAPALRPAPAVSRPVVAKLRDSAPRRAPRLIANRDAAGGARLQPEVRSGR